MMHSHFPIDCMAIELFVFNYKNIYTFFHIFDYPRALCYCITMFENSEVEKIPHKQREKNVKSKNCRHSLFEYVHKM
jgi:hypothetical protein